MDGHTEPAVLADGGGKADVRDEEVDETVLEEEGHELGAAALDADDELVHAQEEDEEVEDHRVDEGGGEDGVARAGHDAAHAVDPVRLDEDALEDEGPVAEDDEDDGDDDALVLRPQRHSA